MVYGLPMAWAATAAEREPMTLRVVAVNPSVEKPRTIPVRIDLPQEITPPDIVEHGELEIGFDTDRNLYFVHKESVTLSPKQTRVFEVVVKDVWFIPEPELEGVQAHVALLLQKLEGSEYEGAAHWRSPKS
jgi:hypothetical protein